MGLFTMRLKTKHEIIKLLKEAGYFIEYSHNPRKYPNMFNVTFDICKSKPKGFSQARRVLKKLSIDKLIQVGVGWSQKSIDRKCPTEKCLV